MKQLSKSIEVMDARDHFKNAARTKGLMGRRNFLRKSYFALLAACAIILLACSSSSPEKDGIKAAKARCDCNKAAEKENEKLRARGVPQLKPPPSDFVGQWTWTLSEEYQKVANETEECLRKSSDYREKLIDKYRTNKENAEKFYFAENSYKCD